MLYIPEVCIRYLRYRLAVLKSFDAGINVDSFSELEAEMGELDPRIHSGQYCINNKGEWGLTATLPDAIIYFE